MDSDCVVAVDPVAIVIKECINLSTAMRKYSKFRSQSGVAALLSNSEIFNNQDDSLADTFNNLSTNKHNDPLLSGFVQLRLMLNNLETLEEIDSLTLLQPFLLTISTSSISGYITSLALDSLQKFLTMNVINESSKNHVAAIREAVNSLTHCRFERSEQLSDDAILLKVVNLLQTVTHSQYGELISDSVMYDVLQTALSMACNKKRSEVLRRAAEATMFSMTAKLFYKLRYIEPVDMTQKYINDEGYANSILKEDIIGMRTSQDDDYVQDDPVVSSEETAENSHLLEGAENTEENAKENASDQKNEEDEKDAKDLTQVTTSQKPDSKATEVVEDNHGLPVIRHYLNLLLSLIVPENQGKHTNSVRIFGLQLINTAIEVSGNTFPRHPRLFSLISDPIFKHVLFIIQNGSKLSLVQAALQLFTTLVIILGDHLQVQIQLTLSRIFEILLNKSNETTSEGRPRPAAIKELLIEQISLLWTRSPSFFTTTFIEFDCNLDRADMSITFISALTKLALPESALTSTESVPPICLEGLISLIDDMHSRLQNVDREKFLAEKNNNDRLKQKERKTEFIKCTKIFNEKPKQGIPLLIEKNFIKSDSERDIAEFLFENNGRMNKKMIGLLLCDPARTSLLKSFIDLFDFEELRVDEAIRILLTKFRLPGESQQIERIIETFSARYVDCQNYDLSKANQNNEEDLAAIQPDADSVFILSYSIIMLNTDLHNPQVKEHMSFEDYCSNLKGCYNQQNFPSWYLDRIYCSIRDKEIVMPEEHHGSDRWFEDAWNNLISATVVMTEIHEQPDKSVTHMSPQDLAHFDGAIFKNVGRSIVDTFFKIFEVASDDHIASRMLGSIDKCSFIASFLKFDGMFNNILCRIATMTTLLDNNNRDAGDNDEIPLVEITVEDSNSKILVNSDACRLGRSFKAQLSMVIFFRIIRINRYSTKFSLELWKKIVTILLVLYEDLMVSPDIFPDLQQRLRLGNLPKPSPEVSLKKARESRGILSAFASYLKGDEEPTEDEIDASTRAMNCVKSSNIPSSIFGNEVNITQELIRTLLSSIESKKTTENSRYFEAEMLFIVELCVGLFLFCKDEKKLGNDVLRKVSEVSMVSGLSKRCIRRLTAYILLLISVVDEQQERLHKLINEEFLKKNEVFTQKYFASEHGSEILRRLLSLTDIDNYQRSILQDEGFWKLLRFMASSKEHTGTIYHYLENSLNNNKNILTNGNFMWILGLLDEISSLGAIGSQWEREYQRLLNSGHKVDRKNPHQDIVDLSLKSIQLTSQIIENKLANNPLSKNETIALIQALAHQCLNPCFQIRSFSLECLEHVLTKIELPSEEIKNLEELIEGGLLPLLDTVTSKEGTNVPVSEILAAISKIYLYRLKQGVTTDETFLEILNIYNRYVEAPEVEKQLQQLITDKKAIEKESNSLDSPANYSVSEAVINRPIKGDTTQTQ
ncbi:ZYBA0S06-03444g1_1 [Zygosaccharomyces bailii CLIB 213]|uniref:ZYBA0S06-03444g1_1 n=1 Tax=Zygosaccharomyces bailii (strain CLIB 213 / ATCC 58445 / CBS 680 / BCRC 21525 / NBRC 1098 / NCYC 1416 / NRRL Y-2227) TaxID=1333698 RepID=A0A8J2T836_ZYGB2|nr:ZYBA0S06-03444g1_1 [Zygosaccharomyces bailii CLIB 213]